MKSLLVPVGSDARMSSNPARAAAGKAVAFFGIAVAAPSAIATAIMSASWKASAPVFPVVLVGVGVLLGLVGFLMWLGGRPDITITATQITGPGIGVGVDRIQAVRIGDGVISQPTGRGGQVDVTTYTISVITSDDELQLTAYGDERSTLATAKDIAKRTKTRAIDSSDDDLVDLGIGGEGPRVLVGELTTDARPEGLRVDTSGKSTRIEWDSPHRGATVWFVFGVPAAIIGIVLHVQSYVMVACCLYALSLVLVLAGVVALAISGPTTLVLGERAITIRDRVLPLDTLELVRMSERNAAWRVTFFGAGDVVTCVLDDEDQARWVRHRALAAMIASGRMTVQLDAAA